MSTSMSAGAAVRRVSAKASRPGGSAPPSPGRSWGPGNRRRHVRPAHVVSGVSAAHFTLTRLAPAPLRGRAPLPCPPASPGPGRAPTPSKVRGLARASAPDGEREAGAGVVEGAGEHLLAGHPSPAALKKARKLEQVLAERLLGILEALPVEDGAAVAVDQDGLIPDGGGIARSPCRPFPLVVARERTEDGEPHPEPSCHAGGERRIVARCARRGRCMHDVRGIDGRDAVPGEDLAERHRHLLADVVGNRRQIAPRREGGIRTQLAADPNGSTATTGGPLAGATTGTWLRGEQLASSITTAAERRARRYRPIAPPYTGGTSRVDVSALTVWQVSATGAHGDRPARGPARRRAGSHPRSSARERARRNAARRSHRSARCGPGRRPGARGRAHGERSLLQRRVRSRRAAPGSRGGTRDARAVSRRARDPPRLSEADHR